MPHSWSTIKTKHTVLTVFGGFTFILLAQSVSFENETNSSFQLKWISNVSYDIVLLERVLTNNRHSDMMWFFPSSFLNESYICYEKQKYPPFDVYSNIFPPSQFGLCHKLFLSFQLRNIDGWWTICVDRLLSTQAVIKWNCRIKMNSYKRFIVIANMTSIKPKKDWAIVLSKDT